MSVVEFRDVCYTIGDRTILRDISLTVDRGETLVLLGRSGSGKTTLLKMVNRLIQPTSGEVLVQGKPVQQWDVIRLRRSIGYVIQDAGLLPHRTVAQNVGLVPQLEGWDAGKIRARVEQVLSSVSLTPSEYGARYPRQLSGGQRQRAGVARALASDPEIMLLDEPFSALDPVTRFELQQQFRSMQRDLHKTSLFVTHDLREAMMLGTRIAVLHEGELEAVLPASEFEQAQTREARAFLSTIGDVH